MGKKVEMIISYTEDGGDFIYNDNHGVLVRCKDCIYAQKAGGVGFWICAHKSNNAWNITTEHYCGYGEKYD